MEWSNTGWVLGGNPLVLARYKLWALWGESVVANVVML